MPNKNQIQTRGVALLALGFALASTPAFAGFQWVSPDDGETRRSSNAEYVADEAAFSSPETISSVVGQTDGGLVPAQRAQAQTPPPAASSLSAPTFTSNTTKAASADSYSAGYSRDSGPISLANETIRLPASSGMGDPMVPRVPMGEDVVKGFASDVPLALAVRQILPQGYGFTIDQDVDMDTLVSYRGGSPWGETLKAMLSSVGLVAYEQGTVVTIRRGVSSVGRPPAPRGAMRDAVMMPESRMSMASADPVARVEVWPADRGDTLRKVLSKWCSRAGFELKWTVEYDYPVEASVRFSGSFEEAVRGLLAGFESARPQPIGELYASARAGQRVLVIQSRGNSSN